MANPARRPAPSVVASSTGEISTGRPMASASAGRRLVVRHAAVDAQRGDRVAAVGSRPPRPGRRRGGPRLRGRRARVSGRPEPRVSPTRVPRAPKSQTGVPRPSSAGTNQTSPVVSHWAATAADSAAVAIRMPRSSRSHSTQVPAESITASMPQVALRRRPGRPRSGRCRRRPAPARVGGLSGPVHWSSMPPVPKVALARPGRVQPWPTSEACWSPAMPQMGGAPGRAVAAPMAPDESTMRRQHGRRDAEPLEQRRRPSRWSAGSTSAVTAALVASVTWRASALSPPREGPGHPGVDRAEAELAALGPGAIGVDRVEDGHRPWWPTRWAPGGSPRPAARGRCRRCAGPASRCPVRRAVPVARSHTMLEARWLAMPTPATGPPSRSAALRHLEHASAMRGGVELHQAGCGRVGEDRCVVRVVDRGVGSHDGGPDAGGADVDDEDAAARACVIDQGEGPNGEGSPSLPGLRMPTGSKVSLRPRRTSKPEPSARGQEAGAVEPDAVVVADGRPVGQGGVGDRVPRLRGSSARATRRRPRGRGRRR